MKLTPLLFESDVLMKEIIRKVFIASRYWDVLHIQILLTGYIDLI